MTLVEQIDGDVRSLELYFAKLFDLLREPSEAPGPPLSGDVFVAHTYTQFVRPDMISNVYSLLDFWLNRTCELATKWRRLGLTHKDIKGSDDLDSRHKFLTKVAGLDLIRVTSSYQHLDVLRETRNCLLHAGGHASSRLTARLQTIPDIGVFGGLVTIGDGFIWTSLKHVRTYLAAVANDLEAAAT